MRTSLDVRHAHSKQRDNKASLSTPAPPRVQSAMNIQPSTGSRSLASGRCERTSTLGKNDARTSLPDRKHWRGLISALRSAFDAWQTFHRPELLHMCGLRSRSNLNLATSFFSVVETRDRAHLFAGFGPVFLSALLEVFPFTTGEGYAILLPGFATHLVALFAGIIFLPLSLANGIHQILSAFSTRRANRA